MQYSEGSDVEAALTSAQRLDPCATYGSVTGAADQGQMRAHRTSTTLSRA